MSDVYFRVLLFSTWTNALVRWTDGPLSITFGAYILAEAAGVDINNPDEFERAVKEGKLQDD